MSDAPGTSCRDVAEKLTDDTLWKIVGFNLVFDCQFSHARSESPMSANDPFDESFVCEMIQAACFSIPLSRCVNES